MCDCINRTFFALRCYQSKLSPAIIKVFVHILKFSPAKKHNVNFLLSYFSVRKSTKSQQGGLTPSSFRTSCGVHELVAQVMRGKCVRQIAERKSVVLPLPAISSIPRVRTYHTRKSSRFVHALSHPHTNTGDAVARIFIFPYSSFKSFL